MNRYIECYPSIKKESNFTLVLEDKNIEIKIKKGTYNGQNMIYADIPLKDNTIHTIMIKTSENIHLDRHFLSRAIKDYAELFHSIIK